MAYGVENAKVVARYRSTDADTPGGYYTQRNGKSLVILQEHSNIYLLADNFAWFALVNHVEYVISQ